MTGNREFDVILVGATGFTGHLVAKWFVQEVSKDLRWAIAGRSQEKLDSIKDSLRKQDHVRSEPTSIKVDTMVGSECEELVKRCKVVVTTVGPYSKLGEGLLKACAQNGTHYCDLTGEIPFVKLMMEKYEETAKSSGSIIICCAGFDSIPADLANFAVAKFIKEKYNTGTCNSRTVLTKLKGGVSGGTLASVLSLLEVFSLRQVSAAHAPWSISTRKGSSRQGNVPHVTWDQDLKTYAGSWVGDNIDRSVAARSWSLLNYGSNWTTYGYLGFTSWYKAYMYIVLLYTGSLILGLLPARYLLKKFVTQPGSGPSQQEMDGGCVELKCVGESDSDSSHKAVATFEIKHGDPGYKGTAAMLASVGLTLALDVEQTEAGKRGGGFWTPACLGEPLIGRLSEAGITLTVGDLE